MNKKKRNGDNKKSAMNVKKEIYMLDWLIDFNDMSNCLVLFHTQRLGNCIHYTYIFQFFVQLILIRFVCVCVCVCVRAHMTLSNKNNFQIDGTLKDTTTLGKELPH